jgi:hypothetical protein
MLSIVDKRRWKAIVRPSADQAGPSLSSNLVVSGPRRAPPGWAPVSSVATTTSSAASGFDLFATAKRS